MEVKKAPLKFLVIRFSSIGDIVLTSPIVRNIKKNYPNCELHFLCKSPFIDLVKNSPFIDKSWGLNEKLSELIPALKKEKFTHIIDLHKNLRSFSIKRKLGIPSYSFDKLNLEKFLLTQFTVNRLPDEHIVDRYFKGIRQLNIKNDGLGLDFYPSKNAIEIANNVVNKLPKSFLVLVIGTAHETKSPPVSILDEIIQQNNYPFVLMGGKNEKDKAKQLVKNHPQKKLYNLCGTLSIEASAAVIQHANLVVTPDTGLMHISAAFNKKIISIWGSTIPEFGMSPYYGNDSIKNKKAEVKGLSCRPCSKIGYNSCPKKHFNCMKLQNIEQINAWIKELY